MRPKAYRRSRSAQTSRVQRAASKWSYRWSECSTPRNQPMLVIQALSAPRLRLHDGRRGEYVSPLRDTDHTLILRNQEMEEAGRITRRAPARVGGISVFHLRHPPQPMQVTVFGRVVGAPTNDADTLTLAGQGHAYVEGPLTTDPAVFEISDLAVGTPVDVNALEQALPFPLLPGARIWTGDALRVYLELYHLTPDEQRTAHYDLRFRLVPLDEVGEVKSSPRAGRARYPVGVQQPASPTSFRHWARRTRDRLLPTRGRCHRSRVGCHTITRDGDRDHRLAR